MKKKQKLKSCINGLKWAYCECGCKCFVAAGTDFHIYLDLDTQQATLWEGRFRRRMRQHRSLADAERAAQRRYDARVRKSSA